MLSPVRRPQPRWTAAGCSSPFTDVYYKPESFASIETMLLSRRVACEPTSSLTDVFLNANVNLLSTVTCFGRREPPLCTSVCKFAAHLHECTGRPALSVYSRAAGKEKRSDEFCSLPSSERCCVWHASPAPVFLCSWPGLLIPRHLVVNAVYFFIF